MISFQEATSLVEAAIQADGGGWGVHVSAGIKGMIKKAVSSSATSFVLGDTRQVQKRTIRNKNARNLSPAARQLLQEDPEEFVRQHGRRYASSITLGGTFGGAVSIHQNSADVESSLEAFAKVSFEDVFGLSGSFEGSFKTARQESSSMTRVVSSFAAAGGHDIVVHLVAGPAQQTLSETPKPLFLTSRSWADLDEVQDILQHSSKETQELFQAPRLNHATEKAMSKEYAELMMLMLMNDVSEAQKWKEVKHNDGWKETVNKMNKQIRKHQAKIEQATEDDFIQLQKHSEADHGGKRFTGLVQSRGLES